ncbi:MAG: GNAT family N-acetyltransferase [Paludibacter sp.]|nr:GNAT family N-acetyltransferase [Paludibacter sp.]
MAVVYRKIEKRDNEILSRLIKKVFVEFGIDMPGTVYTDPTTDALYELFQTPRSVYWIAEENEKILGGCGIYPTEGLPTGYAELVKLYLSADARGKGIGNTLMQKSIESAREMNYTHLYLESFPALSKAVSLYERNGFVMLKQSLGSSVHYACTIWMDREL